MTGHTILRPPTGDCCATETPAWILRSIAPENLKSELRIAIKDWNAKVRDLAKDTDAVQATPTVPIA